MFADYHMHTSFSMDSTYPMEESIKQAISLGFDEICFTDHADYGNMKYGPYIPDFKGYYQEYLRLKEKYKDQIQIKFGCEFGIQLHTIPDFKKVFDQYPFDFIILSSHQVDDKEFIYQEYQEGKTQLEYNRGYYQAILDVMKEYNDYSVLGHLDIIKRYDLQGCLPDIEVEDIIKEILIYAIQQGKGIEVNTSNFRYGIKDLTPSRQILTWYYELGGTIITIGSDSHQEDHVGFKIKEIKKELKKIGFKTISIFEKMKVITHEL